MSNGSETNQADYQNKAVVAAKYAHDCCFSDRWGLLPSDGHFVTLFDNRPSSVRPAIMATLKQAVTTGGGRLVGEASYPADGDHNGYTVALIVRDIKPEVILPMWAKILSSHN